MPWAGIRRVLPFASVLVFLALAYDGWVFYSRWSASREVQQMRTEKEAESARQTLNRIGGTDLKILGFYAEPAVVRSTGEVKICYSVVNAKTLRVEPPIGDVYPALSHCLQIHPRKTTEYTMTASDDAGHSVQQRVTVEVKP